MTFAYHTLRCFYFYLGCESRQGLGYNVDLPPRGLPWATLVTLLTAKWSTTEMVIRRYPDKYTKLFWYFKISVF